MGLVPPVLFHSSVQTPVPCSSAFDVPAARDTAWRQPELSSGRRCICERTAAILTWKCRCCCDGAGDALRYMGSQHLCVTLTGASCAHLCHDMGVWSALMMTGWTSWPAAALGFRLIRSEPLQGLGLHAIGNKLSIKCASVNTCGLVRCKQVVTWTMRRPRLQQTHAEAPVRK